MKNESLRIILGEYKKEHISEEETMQLINDLFSSQPIYYPWWNSPYYTTTEPQIQKFEITCKDG